MLFQSFAPFVALVFAASAFAVPVPESASNSLAARVDNAALAMPMRRAPDAESTASTAAAPTTASFQQIFENASTNLTPILKTLQTAVANKADINQELVTRSLNAVLSEVQSVKAQLTAIAASPVTLVQSLASINSIIGVLAPLLQLLFTVIALVANVIAITPLGPILTPLVEEIGTVVADVLVLITDLAPGLIGGLIPTLVTLVPIPGLTDLASIISL
ncbi:hypothetical protein HYPSUDRAFT_56783 [Hypholoma sublateritium FD-334 SS-4]|uniref:Uncharacterized protein n=1 Tax=Hypholoma sublateritium (strain FD-334 SS-4) TaxID=945553 RepID=A0A0D2M777_HYPSF|nr:hypothetical protein HYPSUDRAFT_56783 [Hypholoma sublateritium FD-334 SS-4]